MSDQDLNRDDKEQAENERLSQAKEDFKKLDKLYDKIIDIYCISIYNADAYLRHYP